jgi:hypothetical protein
MSLWKVPAMMTTRPLPGPTDFAGSLSLTRMGILHNIAERACVVSFVFDSTLSESDRSEPIKASPMNRAARVQHMLNTRRCAGTFGTELLFQANSTEIGKPSAAKPAGTKGTR